MSVAAPSNSGANPGRRATDKAPASPSFSMAYRLRHWFLRGAVWSRRMRLPDKWTLPEAAGARRRSGELRSVGQARG